MTTTPESLQSMVRYTQNAVSATWATYHVLQENNEVCNTMGISREQLSDLYDAARILERVLQNPEALQAVDETYYS